MLKDIFLIVTVMLAISGCDKDPKKEIGYGVIRDGEYSNSYFNMAIKVPRNWTVQSDAEQEELMHLGNEIIAGDDKNLKAFLTASQKQTVNLFAFFKYEIGAPVPFNPSILAFAENVVNARGIKRGSDYHFHWKKTLESGQVKYEFPGDIFTITISGVSFDVMPAVVVMGGVKVKQEFYATRINDYILGFILSYSTNSEKNELNGVVSSLKFSK